ncbi:glycoside hydrolase family 97 protein [Paraglaciecola sp. L3A3]|uniref:glycoside hydrolase family 97 protein n=1 Tax=Paraglaciecola sp. L3A3 TaxID=2686358 RepID=UPI00131BFAA4|nr:glycoside hydrolase family 97 protein [Paraglaciecola sp. L3A3]
MINKIKWVLVVITYFSVCLQSAFAVNPQKTEQPLTLESPNKRIQIKVWTNQQPIRYQVSYDSLPLVADSALGITLESGLFAATNFIDVKRFSSSQSWQPLWGQFSNIDDIYNALTLNLVDKSRTNKQLAIHFRLYDQGLAIQYEIDLNSKQADVLSAEKTQFNLLHSYAVNSYGGEKAPITSKHIIAGKKLKMPVRLTPNNGPHIALHEAALLDGSPMSIQGSQHHTNGLEVIKNHAEYFIEQHKTAWRVLFLADKPGEFLTNTLLVNLSPDSKIKDTSWIKTGKSFWDWRVRGDKYGNGKIYDIDFDSLKHFIEAAAEKGIEYVMIDANWYGEEHNEKSNPYTEKPGLHMRELLNYAQQKGVGFILYVNDKASYHHDLDHLFATYSAWGAAGIKYGFMKSSGQEKVRKTIKIVELAAKHQLLINFHDSPIAPTGLRRTYPNWLTREYVHGQTDGGHAFTPSGYLAMMNLNMLAGPLDMSNGFYKLDKLVESRKYVREEIFTTVAGETARTLITFSGLTILPDSPEAYSAKAPLFEFIKQLPSTWDDSKVLEDKLAQYIVMARRNGDNWYLGAANNEQQRELKLPLDFLQSEQTYIATIYADAKDSHFKNQRESYEIFSQEVNQKTVLDMRLAAGGGQAISIKPKDAAVR